MDNQKQTSCETCKHSTTTKLYGYFEFDRCTNDKGNTHINPCPENEKRETKRGRKNG